MRQAQTPTRRRVTFGIACSLDHYIARADHGVDWLQWTDEVHAITTAFWKTIDTVLMGRKTCERAPRDGYPGVKNYVFSRTWKDSPSKEIELVSDDAATFVAWLKQQPGKGICVMGGGELARSLLAADLIDEIDVNIHPILLGSGIPLFAALPRQIELERLECTPFANGCVLLRYQIHRPAGQECEPRQQETVIAEPRTE